MDSHTKEIENGRYEANIGTTTLKAFCNDTNGFAIYAAGYTGEEIGAENSNKLVGTPSTIGNIVTGTATSAGNPDTSNWAMKLATNANATYAITLDNDFGSYHAVPNEYTKVAHRDAGTDVGTSATGAELTTTYAAYISRTQPAGTYTGKVIYTLVHPSSAVPIVPGTIAVNYNGNGKTFSGGASANRVVYAMSPMYIATTPEIVKSSNVNNDGTKNSAYTSDVNELTPITITGATKLKVVIDYAVSNGTGLAIATGNWDGSSMPDEIIVNGDMNASGTDTYIFNGDTITFNLANWGEQTPVADYDYGFYARVYPVYDTEESGTEVTDEFANLTVDTGSYATTTDWYGSWYADIAGTHYDFLDESEVTNFLSENVATLDGTTVELYRGLTFTEAYTRASKSQDGEYYKQQELTKSMCNTIAITQNQTLKDVRDSNTYLAGKLKDGNCWMLDNLALDPTDSTTAANMSASNTNATAAAIDNLLHGGSSTTGWSNIAVADVDTNFYSGGYTVPRINNASKDTVVTSYGAGSGKVGLYYNYCAASASTYCYESGNGVDVPDTVIDASQDICPANWRMPTGGSTGEYLALYNKYSTTMDATDSASLQYNLSTPLSGYYDGSSASGQGSWGGWWSSAYFGGDGMYCLGVGPTFVGPGGGSDRGNGSSMRCLVGE